MVWATAAWIGGGYVGNVVREEAAGGRAALAVSCVVGGAGEARLARARGGEGWCGQLGADGQNERSSSLTHHSHELVSRRGPSSVLWAISSFVGWLWGGCGVATNCVVTQARCLGASQAFKAAKLQSCYPAVRSRSAPVRRSSTYFYWS